MEVSASNGRRFKSGGKKGASYGACKRESK